MHLSVRNLAPFAVVFASLLAGGCAHCRHSCDNVCIPYDYCPPAPLPYTTYCACPTPVAAAGKWRSPLVQHSASESAQQIPGGDESVSTEPMESE